MFELMFPSFVLTRILLAFLTGFGLMLIIIPKVIAFQQKNQIFQPIRNFGPEHQEKQNTPTMGGIGIILSTIVSAFLWTDLTSNFNWALFFALILFGCIGLFDDLTKVKLKTYAGITAKIKLILQLFSAFVVYYFVASSMDSSVLSTVIVPFYKKWSIPLGVIYVFFVLFVIIGSSNAVNLTDGLDGLAIMPVAICILCFAIIAYCTGNYHIAQSLNIFHIGEASTILPFCASLFGACLGFLWFNSKPASIMMGDVGSLGLGSVIATLSLITKQELLLIILGGLFVIETLSVIIQVTYFKKTGGKRIFLMSPIHHHFEKKGWPETKVVTRFWIASIIFSAIGMMMFFGC